MVTSSNQDDSTPEKAATELPARVAYQDFHIELTGLKAGSAQYQVRLLENPVVEAMRADQSEKLDFNAEEFRLPVARLQNRMMKMADLLRLGERLGQMLLPGKLGQYFDESLRGLQSGQGLRLRLNIEPLALTALPWEYSLVRRAPGEAIAADFLALRPEVSLVRHEAPGNKVPPLEARESIRIVAAFANPITSDDSLPGLDLEVDQAAIANAIDGLNTDSDLIEAVYLNSATRKMLEENLPGADIFHFSGHGVFEITGANPDGSFSSQGRLLLEKDDNTPDRYGRDELMDLLGRDPAYPGVRLVMLGACNSAERDVGGAWSGLAPALVRQNIPAVVGMQFRVGNAAATTFIENLYLRILQGYAIDQAVSEGRRRTFHAAMAKEPDWAKMRDWGTPVLYLRAPDGVLFPSITDVTGAAPGGPPAFSRVYLKAKNVRGKATNVRVEQLDKEVLALLSGRSIEMDVNGVDEKGEVVNLDIKNLGRRP